MNRSTLTAETLNKLRKDTGLNWVDSSYRNDLCDSVMLEMSNDHAIQIFVPNAEITDLSEEKFSTYTVEVRTFSGEPLQDDFPYFTSYDNMLYMVQFIINYTKSLQK